ncbi:MAG: DUF58 domain-containing protein [Agathobacter sp.]|nr:DUF58 domain-containing protein [Agathobacter sp.]
MRMKYISRIQANLSKCNTIYTRKVTNRILDGSYYSVYKGRSMNFDELREYVPGDDIKDMDWKASARSQKLLVKQYVAEKKHNILFVFDTNKRMLADTAIGCEKRDTGLMAAGTLAYLINRNGDFISSIFSDSVKIRRFPFKSGIENIENILVECEHATARENETELNKALEYICNNYRRNMIIVVVTDMEGVNKISEIALKKLLVMHDLLLINVSDADTFGSDVFDVTNDRYLPDFFTKDKKLLRLESEKRRKVFDEGSAKLAKLGVSYVTVDEAKGADLKIMELLEKHKRERR